jgi:hypothetical protein
MWSARAHSSLRKVFGWAFTGAPLLPWRDSRSLETPVTEIGLL